jgi:hypothetical protein
MDCVYKLHLLCCNYVSVHVVFATSVLVWHWNLLVFIFYICIHDLFLDIT